MKCMGRINKKKKKSEVLKYFLWRKINLRFFFIPSSLYLMLLCLFLQSCKLTRAPLGYSAERAPLGGGGGRFWPPCLTPELIGAARRARRRSKALNEKIPMHIKNFL